MFEHRRPYARLSAVVAVSLGVVAVSAVPAAAIPATPSNQVFTSAATEAVYSLQATHAAWSIAATRGVLGGQSDLEVRQPAGTVLARSARGFGELDWVAVNTNAGRLPAGRFTVRVTADIDSGRPTTHEVQLVPGNTALVPGRTTVVGSADRAWLVDVRDMSLHAGDMVSLQVNSGVGTVSVLDDSVKPIFWQQTPKTAALTVDSPKPETDDETFTVAFTAAEDGDYGIVFTARNLYSRTASVRADIVG